MISLRNRIENIELWSCVHVLGYCDPSTKITAARQQNETLLGQLCAVREAFRLMLTRLRLFEKPTHLDYLDNETTVRTEIEVWIGEKKKTSFDFELLPAVSEKFLINFYVRTCDTPERRWDREKKRKKFEIRSHMYLSL